MKELSEIRPNHAHLPRARRRSRCTAKVTKFCRDRQHPRDDRAPVARQHAPARGRHAGIPGVFPDQVSASCPLKGVARCTRSLPTRMPKASPASSTRLPRSSARATTAARSGLSGVFGFLFAFIAYAFAPERFHGWKWLGTVVIVYSIIYLPRVTVQITDKTSGNPTEHRRQCAARDRAVRQHDQPGRQRADEPVRDGLSGICPATARCPANCRISRMD